jgi:hypothetical protein
MKITNKNLKIKESTLKTLLKNHLLNKKNDEFIITEFNISNFSKRVDLVYFNGINCLAFEIKSDYDSLKRLKSQTDEYLKCFDKVIVVVAEKHLEKALIMTPEHVGIWQLKGDTFKVIRKGNIIKVREKIRYLRMMTIQEMRRFMKKNNLTSHDNKRSNIEVTLTSLPLSLLKKEAIRCIKDRYKKRGKNYFDNINLYASKKENLIKATKKTFSEHNIEKFINALEVICK